MKKIACLFLVCVSAVMAVAAFCIAISQLLMSAFTKRCCKFALAS